MAGKYLFTFSELKASVSADKQFLQTQICLILNKVQKITRSIKIVQ